MSEFDALWIEADESGRKPLPAKWNKVTVDQLSEGDVTVKVTHTTINYKDGLALAGAPGITRKFPMVPGIDVVGEVLTSESDRFKPGDQVILNGYGVGEVHTGAYAQVARLKSEWLLHRPEELSAARAAAIGTAGYTAMLCVMALEKYGLTPEHGPIAVSGASGGVGSVAISCCPSSALKPSPSPAAQKKPTSSKASAQQKCSTVQNWWRRASHSAKNAGQALLM